MLKFKCYTCHQVKDWTAEHWHLKPNGKRMYRTCRICRRKAHQRHGLAAPAHPEQSISAAQLAQEVREAESRIGHLVREYLAVRQGPHAAWQDAHDRLAATLQGHPLGSGRGVTVLGRRWWYSRSNASVMSTPTERTPATHDGTLPIRGASVVFGRDYVGVADEVPYSQRLDSEWRRID